MSRFLSDKYASLIPYVPGEQPKDKQYIKLNTNESPFPPSKFAIELAGREVEKCNLYSDPEMRELTKILANTLGVSEREVLATNGSDEILSFAFMAYCDEKTPAVFADVTYGFYKVFADLYSVDKKVIPLKDDFSIKIQDYFNVKGTIFIANPNAPTGIALSVDEIRQILENNPKNVVVIDEAYVDFGTESVVPLIREYDNLLVTQTFSKSRSLAGARLGFGVASEKIINDLKAIKYCTNPYNVNKITAQAGIGALTDVEYFNANVKSIIENRDKTAKELAELGFELTNSKANFIFAKSKKISGEKLYLRLKDKGVLVRYFDKERIKEYVRITIGSKEQMDIFIEKVKEILEETNEDC